MTSHVTSDMTSVRQNDVKYFAFFERFKMEIKIHFLPFKRFATNDTECNPKSWKCKKRI